MEGRPIGKMPTGVTGISIDTRSLVGKGDAFAIKGGSRGRPRLRRRRRGQGRRRLLVVAEGKLPALGRLTAPMIVVPDVLASDEDGSACRGARPAVAGQDHRRHRFGRQDHDQGDAAPRASPHGTRACIGQRRSTITGACR